jgi:5-methyltetrahydrofolate--homocysteine methyltransferase
MNDTQTGDATSTPVVLEELSCAVESGERDAAKRLVESLLALGVAPLEIVEAGLVPGMSRIGERFKLQQVFVPEMLMAARAMKEAMAVLEPLLTKAGIKPKHTAVIGTVYGDMHDIGKNLVATMLRGANFGVVDVGTNAPAQRFVEAARTHGARLVGLSALLTTTLPAMKAAVAALRAEGPPDVKIIVGGAPVTPDFAREIGADGYGVDAARAVDLAQSLLG